MKSLVVLCLIVIGIIFNCEASNDKNDFNNLHHIEESILSLSFQRLRIKYPTDNNGWRKAFLHLVNENAELSVLNRNCLNENQHLKNDINLKQKDIVLMQLKVDARAHGNQSVYWKNKYKRIASVVIVCADIESMKKEFDRHFFFPDEPKMMAYLKKNHTYFKIELAPVELLLLLSNWKGYESKHSVEWLYYLAVCDTPYADQIRRTLKKYGASAFNFCTLIGDIYESTSNRIHRFFDSDITKEDIIQGFKLYGIRSNSMQNCVYILSTLLELKGDVGKSTIVDTIDEATS